MGKKQKQNNGPLNFRSPELWSCPSVSQCPGCPCALRGLKRRAGAETAPEVQFSAGVGQTKGKERRKAHGKGPPVIIILIHR